VTSKTALLSASRLKRIKKALKEVPYASLLGMELGEIHRGSACIRAEVRDSLKQNDGVMHGGAIASLVDTAAAFAVITVLGSGERATTVDLTVNYLRPLTKGTAQAAARVQRVGGRLIAVYAELFDDSGNLAATALTTYLKLSPKQGT
jgi:uncharacterized protein (TIGR00369 family)